MHILFWKKKSKLLLADDDEKKKEGCEHFFNYMENIMTMSMSIWRRKKRNKTKNKSNICTKTLEGAIGYIYYKYSRSKQNTKYNEINK